MDITKLILNNKIKDTKERFVQMTIKSGYEEEKLKEIYYDIFGIFGKEKEFKKLMKEINKLTRE